ncbi:SDR family oxidoreductase [Novosphingobium sp.]|jgi:NAD(P)-dependent dehydrogenase (short-subunit alcohol dehydrogenase family)|uniref:SDR family oxidoreductase n=1 Tax=Novosphingobium sp. TaxID=1874826 RepID=UPI0031D5E581
MTSRTFLVTGASKGIGRATAQMLADRGHHVVGIARGKDPAFPGDLVSIDMSDSAATQQGLVELASRYPFDGVVNNLGLVRLHTVGDIDLADVDDILRVNIHPVIHTVQALLPGMKQRGWGRVVNLSSLTVLGIAGRTAYAGAKAAVNSFTRTWGLELAGTGITVNAVAPGPIETELFRENTPAGSEAEQRFLSLIPMRRLGAPREIAAAVSFLLSDDAAYITGQTLYVDGGGSIGKALG